jgi:hypothetical protein
MGSTSYDRKGKAKISSFSDFAYMQTLKIPNPDRTWGVYERFSSPYKTPTSSITSLPEGEEVAVVGMSFPIAEDGTETSVMEQSGGGLPAFRAFGGGKFFYEGWQLDPFNTALV